MGGQLTDDRPVSRMGNKLNRKRQPLPIAKEEDKKQEPEEEKGEKEEEEEEEEEKEVKEKEDDLGATSH